LAGDRRPIGGLTGRRPLIGVTASRRGGRFMWWCNRLAIRRAGGVAVRIAAGAEQPAGRLDGLVVGGGDDIHPELYGSEVVLTVRLDRERDRLEQDAIAAALARRIPVLGICRGAQMLNVVHGGSLHTDIYMVYQTAPRLRTVLPRKTVHLDPGSHVYRIVGCADCRVNALHHQSVERIGRGLRIVGRDDHDIVQALEGEGGGFLIGVQWHPEFLAFNPGQQNLFRQLVAAAHLQAG
jgi:putative glutamine amidotransferase